MRDTEQRNPQAADAGRSPGQGRGRRPMVEVSSAVLDAAASLLMQEGLRAVTPERVARKAGCSKTTLYKWWPSMGALAAAAYLQQVERPLAFVDTGNIEQDIKTQLYAFADFMNDKSTGHVIAELIGAAAADPHVLDEFVQNYSRPRRQLAADLIDRGKERGRICTWVDSYAVVDQLWGACYHRLLFLNEPLTKGYVDALTRQIFVGISI